MTRQKISGRPNTSWLAGMLFVAATLVAASVGHRWTLAIYALSFWHYCLYWLAFRYGAVPLGVFKRDAVTMKSISLIALGSVYLAAPPDLLSLAVVACGFLLNGIAAAALGSARTYYGHEVAGLPHLRITAFPYSVVPHPMLMGNIAAFSGTMINAEFRAQWWPLACMHVAMNVALLVMELFVTPLHPGARRRPAGGAGAAKCFRPWRAGGFAVAGAAIGAAASWGTGGVEPLLPASVGACVVMYAYVLYWYYSGPAALPDRRSSIQAENTHD